jgi:hypothetical protein
MKPLSVSAVVVATALLVVCTSFSSNNEVLVKSDLPVTVSPKKALTAPLRKATYYYWYTVPGDTYDAYDDVVDEEAKLEVELQVEVDTDPFGGTEVMAGYINNQYPHMIWASVFLYAHYGD